MYLNFSDMYWYLTGFSEHINSCNLYLYVTGKYIFLFKQGHIHLTILKNAYDLAKYLHITF